MEGLDIIIFACRSSDSLVLRNCASALANLAMYGNSETQRQMAARKAMDWLFPLAFSGDDTVAYYALIAIAALAANVDLEKAAIRSAMLTSFCHLLLVLCRRQVPVVMAPSRSVLCTRFQCTVA